MPFCIKVFSNLTLKTSESDSFSSNREIFNKANNHSKIKKSKLIMGRLCKIVFHKNDLNNDINRAQGKWDSNPQRRF